MIIGLMIADLFKFLIIVGFSFVLFSTVGNILLNESDDYDSFWDAMKSLFGAALGDFDLNGFEDISNPLVG